MQIWYTPFVLTMGAEPKDIVLSEYKGGLEKAILKNSTLLVQLNDAFCKVQCDTM